MIRHNTAEFERDLATGEIGVEAVVMYLRQIAPNVSAEPKEGRFDAFDIPLSGSVENNRQAEALRRLWLHVSADGAVSGTIEVKHRPKARNYGQFCLKVWQNGHDAGLRITKADVHAIVFDHPREVWFIRTDVLKEACAGLEDDTARGNSKVKYFPISELERLGRLGV